MVLDNFTFKLTELKMLIEIHELKEFKETGDDLELNEIDLRINSLRQEFKNTGIDTSDLAELEIRLQSQEVKPIQETKSTWNLDVDGDGEVTVFKDGFLILRKILDFKGNNLIDGIINIPDAQRTQKATEIHDYIESLMPSTNNT